MNKSTLSSDLASFLEKHDQITSDTDSFDFNPKSVDIYGLLLEWRSVFDDAFIRLKIEEAIRNWASGVDAESLVVALKMIVPESAVEKIVVSRLQSIFEGEKNCNGFSLKGKLDLDKVCYFILKLGQYPHLKPLLQAEATRIIFGQEDFPDHWKRHQAIEKALADFRKKVSARKNSQAYSLFCWLESFSDRLDAESCYWPGRQCLCGLIINPLTRPTFPEMLKIWAKSARYPEIQFSLQSAMQENICAIPSHRADTIPVWFLKIIKDPDEYPHFLRQGVVEKVKDLRMFLKFEEDPSGFAQEYAVPEQPVASSKTLEDVPEKSHFLEDFLQGAQAKKKDFLAKIKDFGLTDRILALLP